MIGAGPAGLATARNLQRFGVPFRGFEAHSDVGGLWDIDNPRSTVYESAHLISSKRMTEFAEFPMRDEVADFPHHSELRRYFSDFADHFSLRDSFSFNTRIERVERTDGGWQVSSRRGDLVVKELFKGVLLANGTLSEPNRVTFEGSFSGEMLHSADYKSPAVFEGKRVLIVGAGNSGCDIAVDAVHRAKRAAMSVRRGYHFVPKYILGRPADAVGGKSRLPRRLKQRVDRFLLSLFTGDPRRFGFPAPDHALYESHPIVNSLVLHHVGHGDLSVKADVERIDGLRVHFKDGDSEEFDLILQATGYLLHYPFIDKAELNWHGATPRLYLNCFHPSRDDLFVMGLIEASGIGWQGRYEQAELVARYIASLKRGHPAVDRLRNAKREPFDDMRGGWRYLEVDRMAYYVHKETYLQAVRRHLRRFG